MSGHDRWADPVAAGVSAALFARWPEWRALARLEPNPNGSRHLALDVPRPLPGDAAGGLAISTAGGELTIACGRHWHGHWDPATFVEGPAAPWEDAVAFLARVIEEEVAFVAVYAGTRALMGTEVEAAVARAMIADGPRAAGRTWPDAADRWDLWSWRGTFDAVLAA